MGQGIAGKETNANEEGNSPLKNVTVTKDGTKTMLDVNASLEVKDIQIGAVELKDGDSDTRVDIETDGTKNTELGSELFETILSTLTDDEDIELTYNQEHKEMEEEW